MGRNQGPQSGGYGSLHPQLHADQLGDDTSTHDMLPISPETKKKAVATNAFPDRDSATRWITINLPRRSASQGYLLTAADGAKTAECYPTGRMDKRRKISRTGMGGQMHWGLRRRVLRLHGCGS